MKHIFLNLKRFDIPVQDGGVNRIAAFDRWAACIVEQTQGTLLSYGEGTEFALFFPEAHLISAAAARKESGRIKIGCQGVYREDTAAGGNFGAFTTQLTANAARAAGCEYALIGHCEERRDKEEIIRMGGGDFGAVSRILNREVRMAQRAGLKVVYCIGEEAAQRERWREVLAGQLKTGLEGADRTGIVIAYEPVWAIGPGKTPPGADCIRETARFIKETAPGLDVVYGGGLKQDNAKLLAGIEEIDGGLIALTRFQGEIGFYPQEYLDIVNLYLN